MPRFTCRKSQKQMTRRMSSQRRVVAQQGKDQEKPNAMCRQSRSRNDKVMQIDGSLRRVLSHRTHDSNGPRYESINMAIQLACVKNTGIKSNSRSNRRARARQHEKRSQTQCHVQTNQHKSSIHKQKTRSKAERPKVLSARNVNYPREGTNKMKDINTSQIQKATRVPRLKCHDHVFT